MDNSKKQRQKESTRRRIIDAAFAVYSECGFTAATSEIAKEAGVAHGSIFMHFPTRGDLLMCLMEEFSDTLKAMLGDLPESGDTIEQLLGAHIDMLAEHERFYARSVMEMTLLPAEARAVFSEIQSALEPHFNDALARGIESGDLKRLPPHILLNMWLGLLHHYMQSGNPLKKYKKQLIFTYCELLRRQ